MRISSLTIEGYKGFDFELRFHKGLHLIIGLNGSGKTTILNVLGALTGHHDCLKWARRYGEIGRAKVVVEWDVPGQLQPEVRSLEIKGWQEDKIDAFKAELPCLTSYVLEEERDISRWVTHRREPLQMQQDLIEMLKYCDMPLGKQLVTGPDHASLLVSRTGGQRYLLSVGMNLAPPEVPVILDYPERSLHYALRRRVLDFLIVPKEQQAFVTTHEPAVLSRYNPQHPDPFIHLIDLSEINKRRKRAA